jgi:hypothetical protein
MAVRPGKAGVAETREHNNSIPQAPAAGCQQQLDPHQWRRRAIRRIGKQWTGQAYAQKYAEAAREGSIERTVAEEIARMKAQLVVVVHKLEQPRPLPQVHQASADASAINDP